MGIQGVLTWQAHELASRAAEAIPDDPVLATLWPQASERLKHRTVITVLRELLEEGRTAQLVNREEDINLQLSLVIGTLGQVSRQLYLGSFPGPAVRYVDGVTRILRAGLT